MDRSPPSWNPPRDESVDLARGTLRDALGALGNLAQLAGSARVGSKSLEPVLPDVLASVAPMRAAARELVAALRPGLGDPDVADALEGFVLPRIDELERELTEFIREPLRTPSRLGLDRLLARLSGELDAAQSLVELIEMATVEPLVALRPEEVLRQRLPAAPSGKRPRKRQEARLSVLGPVPEVLLKPRTLAALVGVLAEMTTGEPSITVRSSGDVTEIEVATASDAGGELVAYWAYGIIEPTAATVAAAARLSGQRLSARPQSVRLRLSP